MESFFQTTINGYQTNISLVGNTVKVVLRCFSRMKTLTAEFSPDNMPYDIHMASTPFQFYRLLHNLSKCWNGLILREEDRQLVLKFSKDYSQRDYVLYLQERQISLLQKMDHYLSYQSQKVEEMSQQLFAYQQKEERTREILKDCLTRLYKLEIQNKQLSATLHTFVQNARQSDHTEESGRMRRSHSIHSIQKKTLVIRKDIIEHQ